MQAVHPRDYYHEQDKQALSTLEAVPGFTVALKAFTKIFNEMMFHRVNTANKIRLGSEQLPQIYNLLPPICSTLDIPEPELYLEMNPLPNAYIFGDTQVFMTVTSGLIEYMEEDELKAIIAHECGHISSHHVLYHTMANTLLNGGSALLGLGVVTVPLQLAFFYWNRCSEFSCDRAAAIYLKGYPAVVQTMIRFANSQREPTEKTDTDLHLRQTEEYEQSTDFSYRNNTSQLFTLMGNTDPFLSVRANEIKKWCESDQFRNILAQTNDTGRVSPSASNASVSAFCRACGAKPPEGAHFCSSCGKAQ